VGKVIIVMAGQIGVSHSIHPTIVSVIIVKFLIYEV
jgi:hypothetical protein